MTPLTSLLGEKTAKAFDKQLGLRTVADILQHYPRRYSKRGELTDFSSLPIGEVVTVVGQVISTNQRRMKGRKGSIFEVVLGDGDSKLTLAFFNQAWRQSELHEGVTGLFSGKIGSFSSTLQLTHPDYELFDAEVIESQAKAWAELPIPIYPATGTLSSWKIQKAIEKVFDAGVPIEEVLPEALLEQESLTSLRQALTLIHRPKKDSDWKLALKSLKYHEAILLQLGLVERRKAASLQKASSYEPGQLLEGFDKTLPFELTQGQISAGKEISKDLSAGHPMNRMLQGEVGSGKTVVALRAVLTVAQSGGQSAMLAPTEVLASQHYRSIIQALGPKLSKELGVQLLTGQQPMAKRKKALLDMASGNCRLVIGTHALITEGVSFFDLGLVIIDEQHRFGVGQREALKAKAKNTPHSLLMTATPIPRTLAVSIFGDLDISSLRELPQGRQAITTHVVDIEKSDHVARIWQRAGEEVDSGRQVFVVCPRIELGETEEDFDEELELDPGREPANVKGVFEALQQNPFLNQYKIDFLHGQMSSDEKEEAMANFESGDTNILVSTTVIEVGVNVPNASTMVVLDADRFGLSQLHQLRGRVGRGEHAGLCLLVSGAEENSLASQRLAALAASTDGFALSEIDLDLRGEGDVLGNTQSGARSSLRLLRVVRDAKLIQDVRKPAEELEGSGLSEALLKVLELQDAAQLARG
ncbi:MAG: ATP-dependent DNA helicase RecG [Aquiluna sp.]|nr:ATP-dependent DNA helicase RecG [Aquiluna sp.]